MASSPSEYMLDVSPSVLFAAGGFWRRLPKIRFGKQGVEQGGQKLAARGHLRFGVEGSPARGEMADERVDDHIPGAGIEGDDRLRRGGFGDDGDIGNAANIQDGAAAARVAIEQIIDEGNKRRALAADGHVGWPKITDRCHARDGGDDSGFADLQSGGDPLAEKWTGLALMEDGLAVRSDDAEPARGEAKFLTGAQRGLAKNLPEAKIQLADFAGQDGSAFGNAEDFGANRGGEGHRNEIFEARVRGIVFDGGRDAHQGDIDAVDGSAGHEAEGEGAGRTGSG